MKCCAWHDLHTDVGACRHASLTVAGVRWYNSAGEELCRCGQPLHYPNDAMRAAVEALITSAGRLELTVQTASGTYEVSRHYIALHGIRAEELPELARRGLITAVSKVAEGSRR